MRQKAETCKPLDNILMSFRLRENDSELMPCLNMNCNDVFYDKPALI